jgi:hypothetical protein
MIGAMGGYLLATISLIVEYGAWKYLLVSAAILATILFNSTTKGEYKIKNSTWVAEEIWYYVILFALFIANM